MFHMVGVTPEAPSVEAALGGNAPHSTMTIGNADDIEAVYGGYDLSDGRCDLVVFSGPQLSLFEIKDLAELLRRPQGGSKARRCSSPAATACSRAARKLGYLQPLEAAGVTISKASASTSCRTSRRCASATAGPT